MHQELYPLQAVAEDAAAFRHLEATFGRLQLLHSRLRMAHSRRMRASGEEVAQQPISLAEFEEALAAYRQGLQRVEEAWASGGAAAPPSATSVSQFGVPVATRAAPFRSPGRAR